MGFFNLEIGTKDFKQKKKSAAGHKNYLGLIIDRGVIQHCLGFGSGLPSKGANFHMD